MNALVHSDAVGVSVPAGEGEWTEGQFEALVTLHMLKPGQVLTEDDCWAIQHTQRDADKVQNSALDAFDDGRKHGMVSVAGKDGAAMFEELERLRNHLAVEKALNRHRDVSIAAALRAAYRFISQPLRMESPRGGQSTVTYRSHGYNDLTAHLRSIIERVEYADEAEGGVNPNHSGRAKA